MGSCWQLLAAPTLMRWPRMGADHARTANRSLRGWTCLVTWNQTYLWTGKLDLQWSSSMLIKIQPPCRCYETQKSLDTTWMFWRRSLVVSTWHIATHNASQCGQPWDPQKLCVWSFLNTRVSLWLVPMCICSKWQSNHQWNTFASSQSRSGGSSKLYPMEHKRVHFSLGVWAKDSPTVADI